jgi:flavodoxin
MLFANEPLNQEVRVEDTKKILVVYYSRTGNTKKIAGELAKKFSADLEAIDDSQDRSGVFNYLKSGYEAARKKECVISALKHNPSDYDIVIIGTHRYGQEQWQLRSDLF